MDLFPIARSIAESALMLGGSCVDWYQAVFCPAVRPNGRPCYDEKLGSPDPECPVCRGAGAIYKDPVRIKAIYSDQSNIFIPDKSGGFKQGKKTLSLPADLDIRLLKPREGGSRRLLRDKFVLLKRCAGEGESNIAEVLYALEDPVKPTVSGGVIYQILEVGTNY